MKGFKTSDIYLELNLFYILSVIKVNNTVQNYPDIV